MCLLISRDGANARANDCFAERTRFDKRERAKRSSNRSLVRRRINLEARGSRNGPYVIGYFIDY